MKVPLRYLPNQLTRRDRQKQATELRSSRRLYRQGVYHGRPAMRSFHSRPSRHVTNARRVYHVDNIGPTRELSVATGCSQKALAKIVNKGAGAYYSSGSRPNQTAQSWGIARLASAITAGKAAAVDYTILERGCKPSSKALRLAKTARRKYGHGTRKVPKVQA